MAIGLAEKSTPNKTNPHLVLTFQLNQWTL